tara:strand:+ start:67 stop:201 length:135 start_codon:yes stop_codon:yes gene_type:complete
MVSTFFTLILVPVLFSLFNDAGNRIARIFGRDREHPVPVRAAGD